MNNRKMIYDNIDNIDVYTGISDDIRVGLEYLRGVTSDVKNGVYQLTPRVKAIVSTYTTMGVNKNGYEAHREFIDIQYTISGEEVICSLPLEYLKETKAYNEVIDAAFYEETVIKPQELLIGNGFFAVLFPQDGHMPQISVKKPQNVKKVVVNVKIGE